MPTDSERYQQIFSRANGRLAELTDDRCRDIELAQTRALRVTQVGNPMLTQLLKAMKAEPAGPVFRDRAHYTMRRLFTAMFKANQRPDEFEIALNAFVDGQTELAARHLTAEVMLRPWGEK